MNSLLDVLQGLKNKLISIENEVKVQNKQVNIEPEVKSRTIEEKLEEYLSKRDQVIDLNIGGKIFRTKEETLLNFEGSLFHSILTKNKEEGNPTKELFFDRSPVFFPLILNFLRTRKLNLKKISKDHKEVIMKEIEYYGLSSIINVSKKQEIDIFWDQGLSKAGMCTVYRDDPRKLRVHSTTCYTHFLTNRNFIDESFVIELESTVTQTDNYYYIGLINENYNTGSNCMCCNPANSFYIQCDGSTHINGTRTENGNLAWFGQNITITLKVNLQVRQITFCVLDKGEAGPFTITGSNFKVVAGHCNNGNGEIIINSCFEE